MYLNRASRSSQRLSGHDAAKEQPHRELEVTFLLLLRPEHTEVGHPRRHRLDHRQEVLGRQLEVVDLDGAELLVTPNNSVTARWRPAHIIDSAETLNSGNCAASLNAMRLSRTFSGCVARAKAPARRQKRGLQVVFVDSSIDPSSV